ncbi:MAG: GNAT family N-acetyltransferase [Chloroflexota bacterium]|nr:GNAT family N-acetyltransferase [Chloroflexota bacterium]
MVSLSVSNTVALPDGIRPINLRTDLAALADLIELVFAQSMDSSGRAAVREMRTLSRLGVGLNVLNSLGDMQPVMGYVCIAAGRLIGNVSIYPASLPSWMGSTWIIANVAVHPDYRGRGIARRLMDTSLRSIQAWTKGRRARAFLQVEVDNLPARALYDSLNFVGERTWTMWRRGSMARVPSLPHRADAPYITERRRGEWRAEYELAQQVRPAWKGGIGWLRPLHVGMFRRSLGTWFGDLINLRSVEHLVIRAPDTAGHGHPPVLATLWIDNSLGSGAIQLTLMVDPAVAGVYDEALINLATRRFGLRDALTLEHPADETTTNAVLARYQFIAQRTLLHMRWDQP